MIVKRNGGMTEFIPSPKEKREALIHDHVLELVGLMHDRLCQIETACGLPSEESAHCRHLLARIRTEESQARDINRRLTAVGACNPAQS